MIADRGYDSDPLRQRLQRRGVTAIIPYRNWNLRRRYEDGRQLRRYRHRWIIERTFAWLNRNRRLAKDFEATIASATTWLYVASVKLMSRRLATA